MVHNSSLSSTEITANYVNGCMVDNGVTAGLVYYAKLNEGSGSTAGDYSGNNRSSAIVSGTWDLEALPTGCLTSADLSKQLCYFTSSTSLNTISYFTGEVLNANDYYAFGANMPGRSFTSSSYRYGFNGKENVPETNAGAQDFGMREYDNRLGRFFSVDPFTKLVFNKTPYCFAGNSPIAFIDKNGGFQIPPGVAKTYPELNNIAIAISNAVNSNPTINNALIKEFIVASGLDPNDPNSVNEALRVLSYGSGPVVQIDPKLGFSDYGLFSEATPDIIYISKAFAVELKKEMTMTRKGNVKPVYINGANMLWMMLTLWHEGIHYEDFCIDGVSQPDRDRSDPSSLDIGSSATEEIFNCNPPSSPNNLANRVKTGTSTISIENMNLSRYELSKWFKDNTIKNMAKPTRLVPGPYVNPNKTSTSAGSRSSKGGSYGSVRSLD